MARLARFAGADEKIGRSCPDERAGAKCWFETPSLAPTARSADVSC
jgi:hypothetical protein